MRALLILWLACCGVLSSAQELIPKGFTRLAETTGDLDKDGIAEKVLVSDTGDSTEYGTVREIRILKQSGGNWLVWKRSRNAILKSQEGGMMGDPFQNISIENGILLVSFFGGSSWKWNYMDKYRFQNGNFELIGHTSGYGRLCEYWISMDFNLLTGKIIYKKEYERCEEDKEQAEGEVYKKEEETFFKKGLRLNLDNRRDQEIKIVSPVHKFEMHL